MTRYLDRTLLIGDLHLTDKPQDEYKWKIFDQIAEQCWNTEATNVIVAGDIFHHKDRHPSSLVNRFVDNLVFLRDRVVWHFLKGNHDYIQSDEPFLRFLNQIEGVYFVTEPEVISFPAGVRVLFLPHSLTAPFDWPQMDFSKYDYVFFHQTLKGAEVESGVRMDASVGRDIFENVRVGAYGGDIHVPQQIYENTWYVGTPYPTRFGDNFKPRIFRFEGEAKPTSVKLRNIKKHVVRVRSPEDLETHTYRDGDQLRVVLQLERKQFPDWSEFKRGVYEWAKERNVEVHGVEVERLDDGHDEQTKPEQEESAQVAQTPTGIVSDYCERHGVDELTAKVGQELVRGE